MPRKKKPKIDEPAKLKRKRGRPPGIPQPRNGTKKLGRPRVEIDWKLIEGMCAIHCTAVEIVSVTGISEDTLERRCLEIHGIHFADFIRQKRGKGKVSLRRRQWQVADSGDKTMLIWLGKNWLGQTDRIETKNEHTGTIGPVVIPDNNRDNEGS